MIDKELSHRHTKMSEIISFISVLYSKFKYLLGLRNLSKILNFKHLNSRALNLEQRFV